MNQRFALDMVVLDNPSALPVPCDGLLGLDFFKALNSDVMMDFKGSYLKCGNYQSLLPITLKSDFELLSSKKVLSGLPVVSSSIPVPSNSMIDASGSSQSSSPIMSGSKPIVCNAMLDVGSLYTIANSAAARELLVERYGGSTHYGLNDLPKTTTICAGIDGRPLPLRLLRIPYIQIGNCIDCIVLHTIWWMIDWMTNWVNDNTVFDWLTTVGSSRIQVSVNQASTETGIFAADVPGLSNLGLNQGPSLIVGLDVLMSTQLVLRRNGDIMMRLNV